jgi:AbrB family looped-hinge helix DNA binding protein
MGETIVTRGGQITLTKDVRRKLEVTEGDTMIVNTMGSTILVSKKDPRAFDKGGFLPSDFKKILKKIRKFPEERLKRFGIIE